MTTLTPFAFEDHLVRIVTRDGEPWFVARDVCRALDLGTPQMAFQRIPDDEKGVSETDTLDGRGGVQEMVILSEPGLYRLIFRSNKPVAERFRRWVFHEVLPAIRRTGRYEAPGGAGEEAEALSEREKRFALDQVTEARITFGPHAARALWRAVGLTWVAEMDEASTGSIAVDDAVVRFARECLERVPGVVTPAAMLWPAFEAFCTEEGLALPSRAAFHTRFGRLGHPRRQVGGRVHYLDVRARGRGAVSTPPAEQC